MLFNFTEIASTNSYSMVLLRAITCSNLMGSVLDLVFSYNKELEKEVKGSCLVKYYGCLAPSAVSTLSQRKGN
jgi:hypothetical protein